MQADHKDWKGEKGMTGKRDGGKMMKDLNLSDAQKAQMKANKESMKQQSDAIKNDASLSQDQKKAKLEALHKSQKDKMSSVLTAEQKAKIEAYKKDHKNKKWNGKKNDSTETNTQKS